MAVEARIGEWTVVGPGFWVRDDTRCRIEAIADCHTIPISVAWCSDRFRWRLSGRIRGSLGLGLNPGIFWRRRPWRLVRGR